MIEERQTLESRLEKLTKQAADEKLVKIRRYQMMLCSAGLSIVIFMAYSLIFPITVKEDSAYVMNDNQALPLPSKKAISLTKEKTKPIIKQEDNVQSQWTPDDNKYEVPLVEKNEISAYKGKAKEPDVSIKKPEEKQEKTDLPKSWPEWSESRTYQAGDRVMYKGKLYRANETNKNSPPDKSDILFGSSWDEVEG